MLVEDLSTQCSSITTQNGNLSTRNPHSSNTRLSYYRLSPTYSIYVTLILSPKTTGETLSHPGWQQAIVKEMSVLCSSGTWELDSLPPVKSTIGCRWIYTVKIGLDGEIDRLKARLVAKGYTQILGLDYGDTFSPVAKIASVHLFLSMVLIHHWPIYSWILKMSLFMEISKMRYIWRNNLTLLRSRR